MSAAVQDLAFEQGSAWTFGFTYYDDLVDNDGNLVLDDDGNPQQGEPRDFTGFSGRMQVRQRLNTIPMMTLGANDISLGADGRVEIYAGETLTMGLTKPIAIYDLEIVSDTDPEQVERLMQGRALVNLNVTRET